MENNISFEQALDRLSKIVTSLEKGDMPLSESISSFEEGIKLADYCNTLLDNAEQKVKILKFEGDSVSETAFEG